jgi:hypothetical protein
MQQEQYSNSNQLCNIGGVSSFGMKNAAIN